MKSIVDYVNEYNKYNINEHILNATNTEDIKEIVAKYGDEIFNIIDYGYRDIGGCAGISSKNDIEKRADFIKLYRKDGEIVAVALYSDKKHPNAGVDIYFNDRIKNMGRKLVAVAASAGNSEYLKKILIEDFRLTNRNVWGEFSSKAATFALRCGALPIPVDEAEEIMSPKKFYVKKEDGYFYTRYIKGTLHTKIMMGNHAMVEHNFDNLSNEEIEKFKTLAIKYEKEDKELYHI